MEDRYAIVDVHVAEDGSEFSEITKTEAIIDMYRIESFYALLDGNTNIVMYSGDVYQVAMKFQDFERFWREYAGGKVKLFQ